MLTNPHTVWTNLLLSLIFSILKQVAKGHGQIYLGFSEDLKYIEALLCWQVLYEWQCRCALEGLGGCVKLSLKELINKLDKEERQA